MKIFLLVVWLSCTCFLPVLSTLNPFFLKKINDINESFIKQVNGLSSGYSYQKQRECFIEQRRSMLIIMKLHFIKQLQCCSLIWDNEKKYEKSLEYKYQADIKKIEASCKKQMDDVRGASLAIKNYSYSVFLQTTKQMWEDCSQGNNFKKYIDHIREHVAYLEHQLIHEISSDNTSLRVRRSKSEAALPLCNKEQKMLADLSKSLSATRSYFETFKGSIVKDYFK